MEKLLASYIIGKGIIECVNKVKETYYLDIENHIIYTPEELYHIYLKDTYLKEVGEHE